MSLIDKNKLNYLSTVEQFFLALKNSGLALSATDYHLINEWEEKGIPLNILCRAIERGFEQYQKNYNSPRVSLSYFKNLIDGEINKTEI